MRLSPFVPLMVALTAHLAVPQSAPAAGIVRLELVAEGPAVQMAAQHWARALDRAGIRNVRLRGARPADQVGVSVQGTDASPVYVVTGQIVSQTELQMPSGRFRQGDLGRLAAWLDDLAKRGTPESREPVGAFGLTESQFEVLSLALSQPIVSDTKGAARAEAVARIAGQLAVPLRIDAAARQALGADPVAEELSGLAGGTALAYLLRPAGYSLVPGLEGEQVALRAVRARPGLEIWPVGFEPQKRINEILPALYEFRDVNIEGVSAQVVIDALAGQLEVPMLPDHNALARHGIDPSEEMVEFPRNRTTYSIALRRVLFQAGLKFEVRVDEAENPFLWISTIKPL